MPEITIRISEKALKIVGVILGASCLALVVLYLWSSRFFAPKYRLSMYVPDSAGLAVGAPVRLDGAMQIGTVRAINFTDTSATPQRRLQVDLKVEKRYQDKIRTDSTASLTTQSLLGDRYVNISRGFYGTPIPAGGEIAALPIRELKIENFIDSLAKTVQCLDDQKQAPGNKPQPH
jgi:ABC-type transporter Mla subunit MlaD